ncbi:MAG: phosphomevalonate kinase [Candidatus Aenigmatarchaeota archaeon]
MHYSAPCKLFISGEWSILELGNQGMIAAINKRVHSIIETNDKGIVISIEDFNINNLKCRFDGRNLIFYEDVEPIKDKISFIKKSIEVALRFLKDNKIKLKPFKICTWGEKTNIKINGKLKKVGFGGSAAATVAVIGSVLAFHGYEAKREEIYKLATIAHYFAQGKVGSGFDVAASTYGGLFVYKRFDPEWLTKKIKSKESIKKIVKEKWPGFYFERLEIPRDLILLIGWTRESASTSEMIKQMEEFKRNNPNVYNKLIKKIANIATNAIDAFKKGDRKEFLELLKENEKGLADLGKAAGINIETPELKKLCELANMQGAAGKLSGAGGGDCGIAICFNKNIKEKVENAWKKGGIYIIDADIDNIGLESK